MTHADAPGADKITLDRTNLLRLADLLEGAARGHGFDKAPDVWMGVDLMLQMIRTVAVESPHLYGNQGCPVIKDPQ
jgi:hypothetical protein